MRTKLFSTILLLFVMAAHHTDRLSAASPEIPGDRPAASLAVTGGILHPVSGPAIENGVLLIADGRIAAIGQDLAIPDGSERLELQGQAVYPALFDAYTQLGLVEINSVRATIDHRETGSINPSVTTRVAVNPDSEAIPVTRSNGVLLALVAPTGRLMTGRSSVVQLDGWTWEEMTLFDDVALHIVWPRMSPVTDWRESRSGDAQNASRDRSLQALDDALRDARAYRRARDSDKTYPFDSRWESLRPVLEGQMPVIVHADEVQQIQAAVAWSQKQQLKLILYGGYDAGECAELLKRHDIPVIVGGVYRLPRRRWEAYDTPFTLPARLSRQGIRFCISGEAGASNVRNLPYHAAMAAAFGLSPAEALKAVTLYPAQILGAADRVGSLDVGKDATFIVTDGDPLETSSHVVAAFVQGQRVDLGNRHKRLRDKYQKKYERLEQARGPR